MNPDLRSLLESLAKAPLRARIAAGAALVALVAILALAGVVASDPHFVTLYAGLDDNERVAVEKALAEGEVPFRVSNYPGPYTVYVPENRFDQAQIHVALAEALRRAPTGINTGESGAASIFLSSGERQQAMLKREWQETEHLLRQLEFVERATVTTSMADTSPLRRKEPLSVSVALKLRGGGELGVEQADNVARLVSFRFGVPATHVVITDQAGRLLHDPSGAGDAGRQRKALFEEAAGFDRALAAKANEALALALGERKAHVTVTSEWDHEQRTEVSDTIDGDAIALQSTKTETRTPQGAGASGLAGTASNIAAGEFGSEHAAVPGSPSAPPRADATTKEERVTYDVPRTRTQTVAASPRLARLSVSLVLDESLAAKRPEVEALVKAAVGFDARREDVLGVSLTALAAEPEVAAATPEAAAPASESAPGLEWGFLLERGVEIASALVFALLLATSLRGSRKAAALARQQAEAHAQAAQRAASTGPDPELLARATIEDLVRSDPRRVGEILSRWASEESPVGAGQ